MPKDFLGTRHSLLSYFLNLFLPIQRLFIVKKLCTYTHISDCVNVYELPLLPNAAASETFLYRSEAGPSVHWIFIMSGTGLVVTGRIHDIRQNVFKSSFQTGSRSSPSYIFFLIAFVYEPLLAV